MIRKLVVAIGLAFIALNPAWAADPIRTTWVGNLAIEGYDAVAYFTENRAVKGDEDYELEWEDANWRFNSAENLAAFQEDPERYAPQYGGYCAWAVSNGAIAGIDPKQFSVVDDKLYLNYNASIQQRWTGERDRRIELADEIWPTLID